MSPEGQTYYIIRSIWGEAKVDPSKHNKSGYILHTSNEDGGVSDYPDVEMYISELKGKESLRKQRVDEVSELFAKKLKEVGIEAGKRMGQDIAVPVYYFDDVLGSVEADPVDFYGQERTGDFIVHTNKNTREKTKFATILDYLAWLKQQTQTSANESATGVSSLEQQKENSNEKTSPKTFETEQDARRAGANEIKDKKDAQVVVTKDSAGKWTYAIVPAKPEVQATKEMEKPQGKQLPQTGESRMALVAFGAFFVALAGVVFKKNSKKA